MRRLLAILLALHASVAWGQFGIPNNPVGGGPGVLTHVGACGNQQQCYTFCPAGSVLAAPDGASGAVDCINLATEHMPPEMLYTFDTPAVSRICSFVSPDSKETVGCPALCTGGGALVGPANASIPGRIALHETSGNGVNRVRISAPAALTVDRDITLNTADGRLKSEDIIVSPAPANNQPLCVAASGLIFAGQGDSCASTTTSTTSTSSTAVPPSTTSTTLAGCSASSTLKNEGTIDSRFSILTTHVDAFGANCVGRQRISNSASLTICSLTVCLGNSGTVGTGKVHFEIWSEKTVDCGGSPSCPDAKLGGDPTDDSDGTSDGSFDVSTLTTTNDIVNAVGGSCGTDDNGKVVTFSWDSNKPAPTGNFWITAWTDESPNTINATHYWGMTDSPTAYSTTDFDVAHSCGTDGEKDVHFIVGVE